MLFFDRVRSIWDNSSPDCQAAIDVFVCQWWRHAGARQVLDVVGGSERRVDTYLATWPTGAHADLQLAATIRDLYRSVESDSQFWTDVNDWLYSPVPLDRSPARRLSHRTLRRRRRTADGGA